MALLDRDDTASDARKGLMAGFDLRLLVVALVLALLTLLAVLDQYRPAPGSAPPMDWRLPAVDLPRTIPMAKAPGPLREELLGAD